MKVCGIYCIVHLTSGEKYAGQSVDVVARKRVHFSQLGCGKHGSSHLQAAYVLYGRADFEFRILEECAESMLDIREREWIAYFCSTQPAFGYNLESGGSLNKHVSVETRAKMSAAGKGKVLSAGHRAKISAANRGKVRSVETRAQMSASGKRKVFSTEHRAKISMAHKGVALSAEHRARISAGGKGKILSAEHCAKMSAAMKGNIPSTETRLKLSSALKNSLSAKAHRAKLILARKSKALLTPCKELVSTNVQEVA